MKWINRRLTLVACLLCLATALNAQDTSMVADAQDTTVADPQIAGLTLEEAIDLARRNNPIFLQTMNDLGPAAWGVRAANANLFLPNADLSFFTAWQDAGQQRLGGATFPQPSILISQYQFALSYTLNGQTLFQPGQRKAERRAAERRVDDAELSLQSQVTSAYLEVLRLQSRAEQAERELRRTEEHLRLAEAREQVGAGTRLESMQADVARGRAQVALLQAQNAARVAKLRLVQALGVQVPADQIELVSEFEVFEPDVQLNELLQDALRANPSLVAVRADQNAASSTVKVAKASYFPTLSLRASWSGFAREETDPDASIAQSVSSQRQQTAAARQLCGYFNDLFVASSLAVPPEFQNCQAFQFTPTDSAQLANQLIAQNDVFPFDFENEPVTLSAFFSIPLFNGFDRQLQVEQAVAQRNDLNHQVRALELQLRADVTEAVHNLETAYQTVQLQGENTERAREELRLSQERYQLGAGTFLELLDSQTLAAQAEVDQIEAIFQFHQALAMLEAAVGHSLGLSDAN